MFEMCGLLIGLAIYNGITLPINFPWAMYCLHQRHPDTAFDLTSDNWPTVARSLKSIQKEDIPDLEATFPLEANGLRLTVLPRFAHDFERDENGRIILHVINASRIMHHEEQNRVRETCAAVRSATLPERSSAVNIESIAFAWPGWHLVKAKTQPEELTTANKEIYVQKYVDWLIQGSIVPQLDAFVKGFCSVLSYSPMGMLSPRDLRAIVEGSSRLDMNDLRRATTYVDYDANSKYMKGFWRLVTAWPEEKQKQLLKFVTAIERVPAGGAGTFSFKIERPKPENTDQLPTSSTCFRTLFLPKYPSMEVLDKKLTLAFEYGLEGFGTG